MENYVGKRLDGRYEIMEVLGVGGMAVVYKAFDNIDHRIVAVKILKDEYLANADFKRRFMNESKAISVLSHPNIVRVFDVSYGEILQYIVMEYVDGISLKEYIEQQGVIDPREAIYFVTQILRALQHAHDKGIVHRDIKPQNIMLISDGTIKVTDFGIARFSRSETRTMTDGAIGSVHYISPEQAKGSVTDAKTDLYAVGVMLYEMLTGRLPFQSDNAVSVALMQLHNDPVKPRDINPEIPVGLEQIIIRAMQKNQNDRYQSASEILMDIEAFKKNPNVKFDYSYYNDSVVSEENKPVKAPVRQPVKKDPTPITQEEYDDNDDYSDDSSKKKTIAVLCGVLCALVIFAFALITFFLPGNKGLDVPDLIGKNFYTEVMTNALYADLAFNPIIDEDSSEPSGTIVDQSPAGGKIQKGGIITVYVSGASEKIEVPDVYGYEYTSAESVLKSEGFEVKVTKEKSEEVEIGKVIRTKPKKGTKIEAGSLVEIFVATSEEIEPVEVPNLVGMTVSEARAALEEVGLVLDSSRTEYRPSSSPANTIIGHELIGEMALPGTSLAVFVSTGRPPETTEEESTDEDESTEEDKTTKPTTTKKRETTVPPVSTTAPSTKPSSTEPSTEPSTLPSTAPSTQPTEPVTQPSAQPTQPTEAPDAPEFVEGEE